MAEKHSENLVQAHNFLSHEVSQITKQTEFVGGFGSSILHLLFETNSVNLQWHIFAQNFRFFYIEGFSHFTGSHHLSNLAIS